MAYASIIGQNTTMASVHRRLIKVKIMSLKDERLTRGRIKQIIGVANFIKGQLSSQL